MSQMACRHLLIKFSGSRNPVSRRTGESTASVTAEDALKELEEYADKVRVSPLLLPSIPVPAFRAHSEAAASRA